jgi:thiosulfate/3-mercaptopyruvate sulfurtransferase
MHATLLAFAALALSPAAESYPNAKILIEAEALTRFDAKSVVILDARDEKAYAAGHIPGAVRLPTAEWGRAVPDKPEAWAKRLADFGITPHTSVLVYGGADVRDAARAWWLVKYAGGRDVCLLNGGFPAWEKAGGTIETRVNAPRPVEVVKPAPNWALLAEKKDVLGVVKERKAQIIDARSSDEYCGTADTAKRNGHIPGAVAIEWTELLTKDKKFKSAEELRKLFAERQVDLNKPAITYCQSGGRAAVLAFGLELMGAKVVQNYYRSWAEWGNAPDTPVEVPKQ